MFRAAFSWRHPKDWRLILAKNTEKILPTTHNDNPNNRTHIIKFRVTEKEKVTLELCRKRLNVSMSALIRQSLLGKPIQHTVVITGGGENALNILSALLGQCGKIGGNLNQLARHFNTGGRDTEQLRARILTELSALTSFRLDAEKENDRRTVWQPSSIQARRTLTSRRRNAISRFSTTRAWQPADPRS